MNKIPTLGCRSNFSPELQDVALLGALIYCQHIGSSTADPVTVLAKAYNYLGGRCTAIDGNIVREGERKIIVLANLIDHLANLPCLQEGKANA